MEQIATDLTEGKKAGAGRPIKPVIWTDEEASERLKNWLIASGWEGERNYIHNYMKAHNYGKFFEQCPLMIRVNIRDSYSNERSFIDDISTILQYESITLNSLLHDLNIIKQIGRLEYISDWIDKILSGQKTMSIRKTQYMCGYYELWDTEQQEGRGIVEVRNVQKLDMNTYLPKVKFDFRIKESGFDSAESFIAYHRTNFQSVKYAITYQVVDMKGYAE